MYRGHCNICGQLITDASGCWRIHAWDCGINRMPDEKIQMCSWCKSELDEAIRELSKKQIEEGKKVEVMK